MKTRNRNTVEILISLLAFLAFSACSKDDDSPKESSSFILSSPEIGADSLLPVDYTCVGVSATLPLASSGAPATKDSYAIIMHHVASATGIHWYWVLYDFPFTVNSLEWNVSGIGILGTNSVNDITEYSLPCSQGPGIKAYTYTVYSLWQKPSL